MGGCCFGTPPVHPLAWAVTFTNPDSAVPGELLGVPLHPAQLYEITGNILLAALLYAVILRRIDRRRLPAGLACTGYLAGYGLLRFILEWFRADAQPLRGGISAGQWLALGLLPLSALFSWIAYRRSHGPVAFRIMDKEPAESLNTVGSKPNQEAPCSP